MAVFKSAPAASASGARDAGFLQAPEHSSSGTTVLAKHGDQTPAPEQGIALAAFAIVAAAVVLILIVKIFDGLTVRH